MECLDCGHHWTPDNFRDQPRATTPAPFSDSPADALRDRWDWPAELAARGWQHHHTDRNGDQHWTRPGKDRRDGASAVLHAPDGPLVVFSTDASTAPMWRAGKPTPDGTAVALSPFAYLAAYDHDGDLTATTRALRGETGPAGLDGLIAPQNAAERPTDADDALRALLIDWPTFWAKEHNEAEWLAEPIIPAKRSVAIFAPGGTGKSLLSLYIAAGLATGNELFGRHREPIDVLYLDYEMTEDDVHERLEGMGYGDDPNVLAHLHYALLPSLPGLDQPEGGRAVVRLAELVDAQLVVIDTFGRAVHGDENEADTVRAWYRHTGIGLKAAGRAFVRVDHAGKDLEKGQRGTSAKNDDVDVVWRLARQDGDTFKLTAKKRRMGWVPETVDIALHEDHALRYVLMSGHAAPAGTAAMIELLDELDVPCDYSATKAAKALRAGGHKGTNAVVRAAQMHRRERVGVPVDHGGRRPENGSARFPARLETETLGDPSGAVRPGTEKDQVNPTRRGYRRGSAGLVGGSEPAAVSLDTARFTAAPDDDQQQPSQPRTKEVLW